MAEHVKETEEIKWPLSLYMRAMQRVNASPLKDVLKERDSTKAEIKHGPEIADPNG